MSPANPSALFWTYDPELPSFRHRLAPVVERLTQQGWNCEVERLPRGRYVRRIWERRHKIAATDLLVIAKINLALGEPGLVRRAARRTVFDFDDAIWVRKPRRVGEQPGQSRLRWKKFAATCRTADLVVAGNDFLASAARRAEAPAQSRTGNTTDSRVETVPTPVDTGAYPKIGPEGRQPQTLVWIGLPENLLYLELVRPALARLARRFPDLRLRIVSSDFPDWPEVPLDRVPWSSSGEARALASAGIGLMPLADDEWTRGKCAFKLCQYMAAGLPCVASPVGANREVVVDGETGFLPRSAAEWETAIANLLEDPERTEGFGTAGRRRVEELYDRHRTAERTAELYGSLL